VDRSIPVVHEIGVVPDGGRSGRLPVAPLVVLVVTALAAVGLGFAGAGFESLLDPFLTEVFA
jgi:multicomponent Na+:H+ antiporter subunit D